MKKIYAWLHQHASLSFAASALLSFFGAYLSCPAAGIIATLPAGFLLFSAAAFFRPGFLMLPVSAAAFSLALGHGLGIASPWVFAVTAALSALLAAAFSAALRGFFSRRRKKIFLLIVPLLACGAILPSLVCGTPKAYLASQKEASDYLAHRYPDQSFIRVFCYREPLSCVWRTDCSFDYEGNTLTSVILFGAETEDGHLSDRVLFCQETRRSALIEALREGEEPVLVEPDGFSDALRRQAVIPGVYGVYDTALEQEMDFSITFRREKTQKRDFALAIREVMETLSEKGLSYHELHFFALSAGEEVFSCTVTPETGQAELMDLIQRV